MKKIMSIMLVAFLMCLLSVSCRNVYIMDMLPEVDDEDPGLAGPVDIEEVNQWGSELKNDNMKWLRILVEKHNLESGE